MKLQENPVYVLISIVSLLLTAIACSMRGVTSGEFNAGSSEVGTPTSAEVNSDELDEPQLIVEATDPAPIANTPTAPIHNEGFGVTLELPACFDFDAGIIAGPPDPACDINFLPGAEAGTLELFPMQGGLLAASDKGSQPPDISSCLSGTDMAIEPAAVNPATGDEVICFMTNQGRPGYLRFSGADLEVAYTVSFDWGTYDDDQGGNQSGLDSFTPSYTNETLGFQLEFPSSWAGYQATQNDFEAVINVCFTLPQSGPFCALQIDAYDHDSWRELQKVPDRYYLGENGRFIFGAGPYPQECGSIGSADCRLHQEREEILESFSTWEPAS